MGPNHLISSGTHGDARSSTSSTSRAHTPGVTTPLDSQTRLCTFEAHVDRVLDQWRGTGMLRPGQLPWSLPLVPPRRSEHLSTQASCGWRRREVGAERTAHSLRPKHEEEPNATRAAPPRRHADCRSCRPQHFPSIARSTRLPLRTHTPMEAGAGCLQPALCGVVSKNDTRAGQSF